MTSVVFAFGRVSYCIASRIQKEPIYELLTKQDGIHLPQVESYRRSKLR